ncbi:MAG TPA: cytochrome C oxidase subunit IV family protein [Kofleriaceae bacterium]|nr:cytochrome C oxidase subunit IV family protein [Kofleriaceae bacterium]
MKDEHDVSAERAHTSGARYVAALIGLLCLTGTSLGLHFAQLGAAGTFVALAIAAVKVLIVALVFMELIESMAATRFVATVAVVFVALLCLGILGDVAFR